MASGIGVRRFTSSWYSLVNLVVLSVLVAGGLLMSPVSCMCGASVPHAHSLFQLPSHNHAAAGEEAHDHGHVEDVGIERVSATEFDVYHGEDECDQDPAHAHSFVAGFDNTALSNVLEKQESTAVLQAPPSSSLGHAIAMAQPPLISLPAAHSEKLELPVPRVLEGMETTPETPPPRSVAFA